MLSHPKFEFQLSLLPIGKDPAQELVELWSMVRNRDVAELMRDDIVNRIDGCFDEPQVQQQAGSGRHRSPALPGQANCELLTLDSEQF